MAKEQENKCYEVNGERVEVDEDLHARLNQLAARFYRALGYETKEYFDFSVSPHPQEQTMYLMALEAHVFQLNVGID